MPYAPGQQYDFTPLYQGIAKLGSNIGDFLKQRSEENKQLLNMDKALTGMRRAAPNAFASLDEETLQQMAPRDRVQQTLGVLQGHALDAAMQERKAKALNGDLVNEILAQQATDKSQTLSADADFLAAITGPRRSPTLSGAVLDAISKAPRSPLAGHILTQMVNNETHPSARDGEMPWSGPEVVTKTDASGKPVRFGVTGPKQAVVLPDREADADAKLRYAGQLRSQKRSLLALIGDPAKYGNDAMKQRMIDEVDAIDEELSGLGIKVPGKSPAPAGGLPQAAGVKPGTMAKQGGMLYRFDGKNWNPVGPAK